jgi:hypothetical protein
MLLWIGNNYIFRSIDAPTFRSKSSYIHSISAIDFQFNVNLLGFYEEVKNSYMVYLKDNSSTIAAKAAEGD